MTIKEYHELPALSSSKLKLFNKNLWRFKKLWVDGIQPPQPKNSGIAIGNLVDFYAFRDQSTGTGSENFDDLFTTYLGKATPQVVALADELYDITMDSLDEDGKLTRSLQSMFEDAVDATCFNNKGEQIAFKKQKTTKDIVEEFQKRGGMEYYEQLRSSTGKDLVTMKNIETARKMYSNLMEHSNTRSIFHARTTTEREIINQMPYQFEIDDMPFKMLADKVIVNHMKKKIFIWDLKTTFASWQFEQNFIELGYYFQLGIYTHGMIKWLLDKKLRSYEIVPLEFIVSPSTFTEAPFRYGSTIDNYMQCMNGFEYKGRKYKGVRQCVKEIKFHTKENVWDQNMEIYENKGLKMIDFLK